MSSHAFGLVELLMVFGVAIAWALWEIRATHRARQREAREAAREKPREPPG